MHATEDVVPIEPSAPAARWLPKPLEWDWEEFLIGGKLYRFGYTFGAVLIIPPAPLTLIP